MEDSDDDEQLRQAIALSIQDQTSSSKPPLRPVHPIANREIISLDSDDDELSVQTNPKLKFQIDLHSEDIPSTAPPEKLPQNSLGLDRRAMEQERLARKRRADGTPLCAQDSVLESRSIQAPIQNTSHRPEKRIAQPPQQDKPPHTSTPQALSSSSKILKRAGPVFLDGAVKKTWALLRERADDIRLEEVLQSDDLKLAVLSAFQWDIPWLMKKLKGNTRVIFVMQAKGQATREQYEKEISGMPNLKLCFPPMEGMVCCMHSKLMLLSYPTHLRIVVPTANLTPYDWGEVGVMENMLFLIDLPRLSGSERISKGSLTPFGRELIVFLEAKGLLPSVIDSLYYFDFARTKDFAFVHSIGGVHMGKDEPWRRTGYCALAGAVKELGLETSEALSIDYVTSSLGTASIAFLSSIYLAAQGDSGMTEYVWRDSKSLAVAIPQREIAHKNIRDNFHIFFPTHDTIASSTGGPHCAGTVCFQPQCYESPFFEKGVLRDCKSRREGMLMHNKLMFVRPTTSTSSSGFDGWAYVGSANLSVSAWGKLTQDRSSKMMKLTCNNWECGVLVTVPKAAATATAKAKAKATSSSEESSRNSIGLDMVSSDNLEMFNGVVPVPMEYPGGLYGKKKPWFSRSQSKIA